MDSSEATYLVSTNNPGIQCETCSEDKVVRKGTSWYAAVFLVINAALGAGILDFPYAYHQAGGFATSFIVQASLLVFIIAALIVLAYASDVDKSSSYQDTMTAFFGKKGQLSSAFFLALYCFGTCITFMVIVGDQSDRFFFLLHGEDFCYSWYMNRKFIISVTCVVIMLPISFPKRMDFLRYPSLLGSFIIVYVVILVVVEYYVGGYVPGNVRSHPQEITDVFLVVPTITFGYQCHVSVIPIYSCLNERNMKNFIKIVVSSIFVIMVSYTLVASYGYWTFGAKINPDILVSYDTTSPVMVAIFLMAFKTYATYPILLFCGRLAFDTIWCNLFRLTDEQVQSTESKRRVVQVLVWFLLTLVISVFVPNINSVISILGALASFFIFFYPGLIFCELVFRRHAKLKNFDHVTQDGNYKAFPGNRPFSSRDLVLLFISGLFLFVGAFLFGVIVVQSVHDLSSGISKSTKLHPCMD